MSDDTYAGTFAKTFHNAFVDGLRVGLLNDTTPIEEVVEALGLPDDVAALPGVRTLGDLKVALERGDVPKELAAEVKKALKA